MKEIIGNNAFIDVLDYQRIPAKIDTGADSSAIWASDIDVTKDNILEFKLFSKESPFYDGRVIKRRDFKAVMSRSSHGDEKIFYRTYLSINLQGRKIKVLFTLADRSKNNFPILIGRRTIHNKFLVDVSKREITVNKTPKTHQLNQKLQQNPYLFHQEYIKHKKGEMQ